MRKCFEGMFDFFFRTFINQQKQRLTQFGRKFKKINEREKIWKPAIPSEMKLNLKTYAIRRIKIRISRLKPLKRSNYL